MPVAGYDIRPLRHERHDTRDADFGNFFQSQFEGGGANQGKRKHQFERIASYMAGLDNVRNRPLLASRLDRGSPHAALPIKDFDDLIGLSTGHDQMAVFISGDVDTIISYGRVRQVDGLNRHASPRSIP